MQIGQPVAGVAPGGTVSAKRMASVRCTIATPSAPTWISPPIDWYGGIPVWKFGAEYLPVHTSYGPALPVSTTLVPTGAAVASTPLSIAIPTVDACCVVNTAASTT